MPARSIPKMVRPAPAARNKGNGRKPLFDRPQFDLLQATRRFDTASRAATPSWPKLEQFLAPEMNSFALARLCLAVAVLVSHCFYLWYGSTTAEPMAGWTGYTLGQHAVQGFFFLSGLLVAQSLWQSGDVRAYAQARALRIFPALIVCVLLTVLVIGPAFSALSAKDYLTSSATAAYILKTISLSTGSAPLPGLFESNPVPSVVNSSLWTLKYEVLCYAALAAIGWLAIASRRSGTIVATALSIWFLAMLYFRPSLSTDANFTQVFLYFSLFFGAGAAAFIFRSKIPMTGFIVIMLGAAAAWTNRTDFQEIALAMFIGYTLLWLCTLPVGGLRAFTNNSDYSYGTYIYGVPVAQSLLVVYPTINLFALIGYTMAATLLLAFLSWELIERPALAFKRRRAEGALDENSISAAPPTRASTSSFADENAWMGTPQRVVAKHDDTDSQRVCERVPDRRDLRLSREQMEELRRRLAARRGPDAAADGMALSATQH